MNVLFVCVQNAGRSQMAAAFFDRFAGREHASRSAGSTPAARVHSVVVEAMAERDLDLSQRTPRRLSRADVEWADVVVTMGCGDTCPVVPGAVYVDWELDDPAGKDLPAVREIRDEVERRVQALVASLPQKIATMGQ